MFIVNPYIVYGSSRWEGFYFELPRWIEWKLNNFELHVHYKLTTSREKSETSAINMQKRGGLGRYQINCRFWRAIWYFISITVIERFNTLNNFGYVKEQNCRFWWSVNVRLKYQTPLNNSKMMPCEAIIAP